MGDKTSIEWTRSDDGTAGATWNPVVGCTKVSEGCDHCYAERLVEGRMKQRYPHGFGIVRIHPDRVNLPLRWRRPRRVFVNSLSDLFHEQIPDPWRVEIFAVMAAARRHTFQVLTKRPGPMASLLRRPSFQDAARDRATGKVFHDPQWSWAWPLPNVWLGTSVENQKWADVRIPKLLETPAAVRFLSCEPLLGPVDISPWLPCHCPEGPASMPVGCAECAHPANARRNIADATPIDWVIVGGESGPKARPMHPQWARDLRDQCQAADVAFFMKQWGEWAPRDYHDPAAMHAVSEHSGHVAPLNPVGPERTSAPPEWQAIARVGKKAAGRELDGREWNEYPR